jgi:hypothetical protein
MAAISAETTKHYGGSYDPEQARTGRHDVAKRPSGNDAGGSI